MSLTKRFAATAALAAFISAGFAAVAYEPGSGSFPVATAYYEWTDTARNRQVPVKIYFPESGAGPFPVILFSHGLGGTRDGYEYLGTHWASHGYVSVHLQHIGSDDAVWRGVKPSRIKKAMREAIANPQNSINRPLDVRFAIDQLTRLNRSDVSLKGRLDLDHIGLAGHSFGAYTTLACAGQVFVGKRGKESSLPEPRIKAAIPMSAPVSSRSTDYDKAYGSIQLPCLHMTGTEDESVVNDTRAEDRRIPFDHIHGADQYLVIFEGGDHMVFSGARRLRPELAKKDAIFHELIRAGTTAFWDAYLKNDAAAMAWLAKGGFATKLDGNGTFEMNLLSAP